VLGVDLKNWNLEMLGLVFTVVVSGVVMLAKWKFGKLQKTKTAILEANL
jgi:hypothetical protein